jgi:ElaB/YqjD/DUF883 family membrane-anchored ribosome-binding protein/xanthosine utilization system XapX-like protein
VENQVTVPGKQTPELIQDEMQQTRESLTEKVAALENQVVGSVQSASDTLSDTVAAVKSFVETAPGAVGDSVRHAASAVSEQVKDMFGLSEHVRNHPWRSVGVSAGLGILTGLLVFRGRVATPPPPVMPSAAAYVPPPAPPAPGMFDGMLSVVGRKLREVTETIIDAATSAVNKNVSEGVPRLVDAATGMAADRLQPVNGRSAGRFNRAEDNG